MHLWRDPSPAAVSGPTWNWTCYGTDGTSRPCATTLAASCTVLGSDTIVQPIANGQTTNIVYFSLATPGALPVHNDVNYSNNYSCPQATFDFEPIGAGAPLSPNPPYGGTIPGYLHNNVNCMNGTVTQHVNTSITSFPSGIYAVATTGHVMSNCPVSGEVCNAYGSPSITGCSAAPPTPSTVKLRTKLTKGAGSKQIATTMAFTLLQECQKNFRRINGEIEHLENILNGLEYKDGIVAPRSTHHEAAAC